MEQVLFRGWFFIVFGALAIGVGGLLTTLGWNLLNQHSQMKMLIVGIVREWEINETLLTKEPLFNSTDDKILGAHRLYPRFKTSALSNALTSGLFSSSHHRNKRLLQTIADYKETLDDANIRLNVSDNFVVSARDQSAIANHRRLVQESVGFKGILIQHKAMGDFLKEQFPSALSEKFL